MADWSPKQYLLFKKQRTQPAIDLAKRIQNIGANCVLDIGCGPGNSTKILKDIFPHAEITGMDHSFNMIEKAKKEYPDMKFILGDAAKLEGNYDVLFSNACLQWIPNHERLIPYLMSRLNENGVLAVQIPMNQEEPLFRIIKEVVQMERWNFKNTYFEKNDVLSPQEYFEILSDCSSGFEMWETVYYHVLPSHFHLIEWVRGTRLRPYLEILEDLEKKEFEEEILSRVKKVYKPTSKGEVVLKFKRFFFVARK